MEVNAHKLLFTCSLIATQRQNTNAYKLVFIILYNPFKSWKLIRIKLCYIHLKIKRTPVLIPVYKTKIDQNLKVCVRKRQFKTILYELKDKTY